MEKITAMTRPKMARTIDSTSASRSRKSIRARLLISLPAICPSVRPSFRMDTTSAPKSCTAPMKIDPSTTHSSAGSQPQNTAIAGPTMGPVPAMLVK